MERQLEFPFIKEMYKLDGKICNNCRYETEGLCDQSGEEISEDDSCGDWEYYRKEMN